MRGLESQRCNLPSIVLTYFVTLLLGFRPAFIYMMPGPLHKPGNTRVNGSSTDAET